MCLMRCDVRIRTTWPGGSGVRRRPGHHRMNCQQEPTGDWLRGETDIAGRNAGGAQASSAVHRTRGHGSEGVLSPSPDNRVTETDHGPANTAAPTPRVRSLDVRTTAISIEPRTGGCQENPEDGRNGWGPPSRIGWYDTRCQTVGGRSPSFEDAVSECAILSSLGSPSSPPATGTPRTEVSRLPGLFRIR